MKVRLAFGRWSESPDSMPTLVAAVDEYTEDTWNGLPDFYIEEVERHNKDNGEVREVIIEVADAVVLERFKVPAVAAKVMD